MTDDATLKPRTYSRRVKFPAALPRTMTTNEQRTAVDAYADSEDMTLGEAVRDLVSAGLAQRAWEATATVVHYDTEVIDGQYVHTERERHEPRRRG